MFLAVRLNEIAYLVIFVSVDSQVFGWYKTLFAIFWTSF